MDRGLNLVLQAGPANARLTRFLFVTPCFCVTLPQQSHCLPRHRHRIPRCDNTMPFASIWLGLGLALTSITGTYRLTLKNVCRARHTTRPLKAERLIRAAFESQNLNSLFKLFTVHWLINAARLMATLAPCGRRYDSTKA